MENENTACGFEQE